MVLPGSIADQHNLATGMKIVAIDKRARHRIPPRRSLCARWFERESGDHVRLLVLSRRLGLLPVFVDLAGPPVPLQ
ncbi:MAG: hypothetical protein WDM96_04825 [Lacunisphaera sp.]